MSSKITAEVLETYQRDGVVCLNNVFDQQWIEKLKEGIERNLRNPSIFSERLVDDIDGQSGAYFNDYCNWQSIPEFQDFIYNSPAAEISGLLMDSDYAVFYHEHVLVKEAKSSKKTPWHMDQSYYPIDGLKVCSIWLPLDPVPIETSIAFAVGSHLDDKWYKPRKFATHLNYQNEIMGSEQIREYYDVPSDRYIEQNYSIVRFDVQPGDCIVFHMRSLHSAPGNDSLSISRRVLSTRWLGKS